MEEIDTGDDTSVPSEVRTQQGSQTFSRKKYRENEKTTRIHTVGLKGCVMYSNIR